MYGDSMQTYAALAMFFVFSCWAIFQDFSKESSDEEEKV
jgi:hypothetical protein